MSFNRVKTKYNHRQQILKLGKYHLDIEEFENTIHTGNHPSRGDGDVYCNDIEYVHGVVH